ncbi:hypothetical protein ABDK00_017890 [Niabella insulamsoli]|uniref:hypothetical protein n=1 Tax=Niabella insulamsoli TaxID=3144874 RepID=UPI0031FC1C82
MKFRRLVSLLVIAAILIAFFTNPKEEDFTAFIQPNVARLASPPLIEYKNNLIYSNALITYYNTTSVEGKFIAAASKEKYVGLFGRFWKINN